MQIVYQNQQLAFIGLGKIQNPVSGKTEVNIEQAKVAIDILDMLVQRTKGNLNEREEKFLQDTLSDLKVNYIKATATK